MNQSNTKNNTGLLVFILLLILGLSVLLVYRYMNQSIKSDELPIKCDECYISYPIPQTLQYKERNKIIEIDSNKQSEETEYTYSYSKQDNEIKYYKDNTLVKTKSILFNDDKLFILKTDDDKIEIGSYKKCLMIY